MLVPFTIAINTSLSAAVDLGHVNQIVGIMMPADWDAADVTFQSCEDGTLYQNVHEDTSDTEVTVQAGADRNIYFKKDMQSILNNIRKLKVRSGTGAVAVNQTAARTGWLICR